MDLVIIQNDQAVTSSLTIAEGTGSSHEAVIKLTRRYKSELEEFGPIRFEIRMGSPLPQGGFGKAAEYANLNEHQATLLLTFMKNTEPIRAFKVKLVKAFYDMAERLRGGSPIPKSLPEALRLAADQAEALQRQKEQIAVMRPKVIALDRISNADGSITITNAAKDLQVRPKDLFSWLDSHGWIYRRGGVWSAYQDKIQAGLLKHKVDALERGYRGIITEQVRITPKGLARLAQLLNEDSTASDAAAKLFFENIFKMYGPVEGGVR